MQVSNDVKDAHYTEALDLMQKMQAANAFPVAVQIFQARAYAGNHEYQKAIPILEKILQKDPDNSQALNAVAEAYEKSGQADSAVRVYKKLVETQGSLIALENYAKHMMQLGHRQEIIDYIAELQSRGKLTEKYDEILGEIYLNLKDYDKAIADHGEAIRLDPQWASAYFNRANANRARRAYERAVSDYREVIRLDPVDADAYSSLAWLLATCPEEKVRDG